MRKQAHRRMRSPRRMPTQKQLESELKRERRKGQRGSSARVVAGVAIVAAALAALIAVFVTPVFEITGTSMTPTLEQGEYVVAIKGSKFNTADVVAINFGSRVLVKRVIAGPGQWVNVKDTGEVTVDGHALNEPYLTERAKGKCDIQLPYQVPDDCYFVMGDHRSTSVDSRSSSIGCVSRADIVGKIEATVWPLSKAGLL